MVPERRPTITDRAPSAAQGTAADIKSRHHRLSTSVLTNVALSVFVGECAMLILPLVVASLARPFALWDYFTGIAGYLPFDPFDVRNILRNYYYNLFDVPSLVRPTYALLLNLQYACFGGEFWLFYVVKWLAKVASVCCTLTLLRHCGADRLTLLAVASLLLFHPVSFELMLLSADGWVALAALVVLVVAVRFSSSRNSPADLTEFTPIAWIAIFILWVLACGTKEIGLVFGCVWLAMAHLRKIWDRRFLVRVAPFYAFAIFFAWRILGASRLRTANFDPSQGARLHWSALLQHLACLVPRSRFEWLAAGGVLVALLSVYAIVKVKEPLVRRLYLMTAAWGVGSLLFASTANVGAARYTLPALFAFAVPFGLAAQAIPQRLSLVKAVFAVGFPLLMAGNQYRQALAYQQLLYETSDVLNFIDAKVREGYAVYLTGDQDDIPPENQAALSLFFERYGPSLYGRTRTNIMQPDPTSGLAAARVALISQFALGELLSRNIPGLAPQTVTGVYQVQRGGYGLLERMTDRLTKISAWFGAGDSTAYDVGAPVVSANPWLYVYLIDQTCDSASAVPVREDRHHVRSVSDAQMRARSGGTVGLGCGAFAPIFKRDVIAEYRDFKLGINRSNVLVPSAVYSYTARPMHPTKLQIPLETQKGRAVPVYAGDYRLGKGAAIFGVTDERGNDLWASSMSADGQWHNFPSAPSLDFADGHQYFAFVYAADPGGVEFAIRDARVAPAMRIQVLPGFRRFGAMAR